MDAEKSDSIFFYNHGLGVSLSNVVVAFFYRKSLMKANGFRMVQCRYNKPVWCSVEIKR